METYPKILWTNEKHSGNAANKYVDATKTIEHKLSMTDKKDVMMKTLHKLMRVENNHINITTSVTVNEHVLTKEDAKWKFYHRVWMNDKKHADDAAATVLISDSSYLHQNDNKMIKPALAEHSRFWEDEPGDNGISRQKFLKQSGGFLKPRCFLFFSKF